MTDDSPRLLVAAALRRERERSGLSLTEAARRAGLGKSTLSQLESGAGNPNLETMWSLATTYGVPLARLLDAPDPGAAVIRLGEPPALASSTTDYVSWLLSASPPHARRDLYLISAQPGEVKESMPHPVGTTEHVVVGRGRVRISWADRSEELSAGDYLRYPGDVLHTCAALEPDSLVVYVVETA